jgi:hypothetical protein
MGLLLLISKTGCDLYWLFISLNSREMTISLPVEKMAKISAFEQIC